MSEGFHEPWFSLLCSVGSRTRPLFTNEILCGAPKNKIVEVLDEEHGNGGRIQIAVAGRQKPHLQVPAPKHAPASSQPPPHYTLDPAQRCSKELV